MPPSTPSPSCAESEFISKSFAHVLSTGLPVSSLGPLSLVFVDLIRPMLPTKRLHPAYPWPECSHITCSLQQVSEITRRKLGRRLLRLTVWRCLWYPKETISGRGAGCGPSDMVRILLHTSYTWLLMQVLLGMAQGVARLSVLLEQPTSAVVDRMQLSPQNCASWNSFVVRTQMPCSLSLLPVSCLGDQQWCTAIL